MKQSNPPALLMTELKILMYNVQYAIKHYLYSHLIFMLPITVYIILTNDLDSGFNQSIAYSCLVAWFAYGLYRTQQRKFVATIAALFIWSQYAFYAEAYTLDVILTSICVILMCIKQYVYRYHFAITHFMNKKS